MEFPEVGNSITLGYNHCNNSYTVRDHSGTIPELHITCNDNRIWWTAKDNVLDDIINSIFEHSLPLNENAEFNRKLLWRFIGYTTDNTNSCSLKIPNMLIPTVDMCSSVSSLRQFIQLPSFPLYSIYQHIHHLLEQVNE